MKHVAAKRRKTRVSYQGIALAMHDLLLFNAPRH